MHARYQSIIDDREKVEKKVRNVGDVYKVGRNPSDGRQCPGRSPAICHRGFKNSKIPPIDRDDFILEIKLADTSPIIKQTLFLSADAPTNR